MQTKLQEVLTKEAYPIEELVPLLNINKGILERLFKEYKMSDKGFRKADIIFRLMGRKKYEKKMFSELESK